MKEDVIIVTILDDGTVKTECPGAISAANHGLAESVLGRIESDLGGETVTTKLKKKHTHTHEHGHTHAKQ